MKVLFVHQGLMSFVRRDLDILRSVHDVREQRFRGLRDIPGLAKGTVWADLTFSWFGKLHAFFAVLFSKLLDKKSVVVAGGDDVACEPEIGYGMFSHWWKMWCPLFVFRHTDLILSVSEFNRRETIENARASPAKVRLLYHGFNPHEWRPVHDVARERLAITVGGVDWERLERKGYERFVRSAVCLPDVQFALIGQWHDGAIERLRQVAPGNVTFAGPVSDDALLEWLGRAKVYVQASVHEGFGCSLAEAMLCECVPVVSRRAALTEVVGDCGFYVDGLTPEAVAVQVSRALRSGLGPQARTRIEHRFPLDKRRDGLLRMVDAARALQ